MSEEEKNSNKCQSNIDDKLFKVKYVPDDEPHIKADQSKCLACESKVCTYICPAHVYEWDEAQKKLMLGYENCLECGACRICCEREALDWNYPKGTKGVTFKQG